MTPTPKWNEELPLGKPRPAPPVRRFEITIDKQKPISVLIKQPIARMAPAPLKERHLYEIKGTCLRDDELIMNDTVNDGLHVDLRGGIHRVGERITNYPSGRVISRAKLRDMKRRGQIVVPPNMVNSFPSARIRRRPRPLGKRMTLQALAVSNPAAFHALAINPDARIRGVIIGHDGSVYTQNNIGFFKKVGKFAKKAGGAVAKGVKKGVKVTARTTTTVTRPATRFTKKAAQATYKKAIRPTARATSKAAKVTYKKGVKPVAKFAKKHAAGVALTVALGPAGLAGYIAYKNSAKFKKAIGYVGKLTKQAFVGLARAVASAAAVPIRIAFKKFLGAKRAIAIAQSQGRSTPNSQDKKLAVQWGFGVMVKKMGPLGKMGVEILKFSRGTALAGMGGTHVLVAFDRHSFGRASFGRTMMGAVDPATISAIAGAITAGLAAISGSIKFYEGLKKGDIKQAASAAVETTAATYLAQQQYKRATTPAPAQMPSDPGYGGYGSYQDAGTYQSYGTAMDYQMPPQPGPPAPYPGYSAPPPPEPYGIETPGMLAPDPMAYPSEEAYAQEAYSEEYAAEPYAEDYAAEPYVPAAPMETEFDTSYATEYDTAFTTMGARRIALPSLISFGR